MLEDRRQQAVQNYKELGHTALSYSALKKLRQGGINEFYRYKERELDEYTSDSLDLGTLIDEYLLNNEKFSEKFIVDDTENPNSENKQLFAVAVANGMSLEDAYRNNYKNAPKTPEKCQEKAEELYKELKDYIEFLPQLQTKTGYSKENSYVLNQIRMNISGHKFARDLFPWTTMSTCPSHIEIRTHVKTSAEYEGFGLKGELDMLHIDHDKKEVTVYDLKSTSYYVNNFDYEAKKLMYYMQLYLYGLMVKHRIIPELEGEHGGTYTLNTPKFIVVRTQGNYDVAIKEPNPQQFADEKQNLVRDIELLTWHYSTKRFKYSKEYYEGDGIEMLDYMEDLGEWKEQIGQKLSEMDGTTS